MALKITGPDVGDHIAHLVVRTSSDLGVSLEEIPGNLLVLDMFRGHW